MTKLNGKTVATFSYRWDTLDPNNKGWYVEAKDEEGDVLDDSMKVWFPVDVDAFSEEQESDLVAALTEKFPAAEITSGR